MPARRAVVGREQAAEVALPGRPQQRVGDGVERRRRRRSGRRGAVPGDRDARRGGAAGPGPNGWLSWPNPTRGAAGRAELRAATRTRSSGSVTLRFAGSPGIAWTVMVQASSSAASSVKVGGPSGGNARRRRRGTAAPRALRGLRGGQAGPVDGAGHAVAVDRA